MVPPLKDESVAGKLLQLLIGSLFLLPIEFSKHHMLHTYFLFKKVNFGRGFFFKGTLYICELSKKYGSNDLYDFSAIAYLHNIHT